MKTVYYETILDNLKYMISDDCALTQFDFVNDIETCINIVEIIQELDSVGITPEDIKEYKKFEDELVEKGFTFNSLLEAREKQIPFKTIEIEGYERLCKCGHMMLPDEYTHYCPYCGQKLDWENE